MVLAMALRKKCALGNLERKLCRHLAPDGRCDTALTAEDCSPVKAHLAR